MKVNVKRERLIILLGVFVALVFFYLGLNEWLKTKEQPQVPPPPVVVRPSPQEEKTTQTQTTTPQTTETKQEAPSPTVETPQPKQEKAPEVKGKDPIAQKIEEEKRAEMPAKAKTETRAPEVKKPPKAKLKTYTVQVGAFRNKEGAEKVAAKARRMGYRVNILEEESLYKVRLLVNTANIESELRKLRAVFGGAILK